MKGEKYEGIRIRRIRRADDRRENVGERRGREREMKRKERYEENERE